MEEHERQHPPPPRRSYTSEKRVDETSLEFLWDIDGVVGFAFGPDHEFSVSYDPTVVTSGELDENICGAGFAVVLIE